MGAIRVKSITEQIMGPIPTEPPEETFTKEVLPSYDQYMADPGNAWKAKCGAFFAGHLLEWVFWYYEYHDPSRLYGTTKLADFRDIMFRECPDLQIVFDFAEVSKHRFLTIKPEKRIMTTATDAFLEEKERLYLPDVGQYYDGVLKRVINFWRGWSDVQ